MMKYMKRGVYEVFKFGILVSGVSESAARRVMDSSSTPRVGLPPGGIVTLVCRLRGNQSASNPLPPRKIYKQFK